jgi:hypothetical protein
MEPDVIRTIRNAIGQIKNALGTSVAALEESNTALQSANTSVEERTTVLGIGDKGDIGRAFLKAQVCAEQTISAFVELDMILHDLLVHKKLQ